MTHPANKNTSTNLFTKTDDKSIALELESDQYGRLTLPNALLNMIAGAASSDTLTYTNGACHDNAACGDAECGNMGC